MIQELFAELEKLYPNLVAIRRDLHMYPEVSYQEIKTPAKVAEYLTNLGLEVRTGVGGNGVVGYLRGGKPGKTVALRADFDALPIQDEKEVPYKSRIAGVMHACGHDIHTASLLGVATVLSKVKEFINGNVVFIHQFAEEVMPGGAQAMIKDGCLEGVDVIYGAHVDSDFEIGEIATNEGYLQAASDVFEINILGSGGHAAQPHLAIDSVTIGCHLVVDLQQIVSRRVDPMKPAVLTVGSFHSGDAANVIADTAKLTGTVRTYDEDVRDEMERSFKQICELTAHKNNARVQIEYVRGYPSLYNDPNEYKRVTKLAERIVGEENCKRKPPEMGAEDFAYYLQKVPGSFVWVGGRNKEIKATYPAHHPKYDVDERSMLNIGKLFISAVFDYLAEK